MDFEVIEKEVKYTPQAIKCFCCQSGISGEYTHALMKNTFYCSNCVKDLPFLNSIFDVKFREIEKKLDDMSNSLLVKNKKIKQLEEELDNVTSKLNSFFEEIKKIE